MSTRARSKASRSAATRDVCAGATNAVAVGTNASAQQDDAIAVGDGAQATGVASIAIGAGALAEGSIAMGTGAHASNGGSAFGDHSTATGINSTAVGNGATATPNGSAAFGQNAVATLTDQQVFGTAANTYTAPGITSPLSQSRQSGPLQLVTTDANGNLASDNGDVFKAIGQLRAGVAVARRPRPRADQRESFGKRVGWGNFQGDANAVALSAIGVFCRGCFTEGDAWRSTPRSAPDGPTTRPTVRTTSSAGAPAFSGPGNSWSSCPAQGHFTTGGIEERIESTLPPVLRPNTVPRS